MKLPLPFYQNLVNSKIVLDRYFFGPFFKKYSIKDMRVLDFGCGLGGCSPYFDPSNYLGVDIDESRINYAKKAYPDHSFSVIEDGKLPFESCYYDTIFVCGVFHHMSDSAVLRYISDFHRILKPNCEIVAFEPFISPKSWLNNYVMKALDEGKHIRSENEYANLFTGDGFNVQAHKKIKTFYMYNILFFSAKKV